jgi:hypothetical protein
VGLGHGAILSFIIWLVVLQPSLGNLVPSYRRLMGDIPWLVSAWEVPRWLQPLLALPGMVAVGLSGLVTARLVRPRNRDADVAAGLVSGAVAGVVLFALSFGWLAEVARIQPRLQDVALLSMAAWNDPEARDRTSVDLPPSVVRERLLEKYPGLQDVPAESRARAMFQKVTCDLYTAIPVSLWSGMIVSIGCCTAFGAISTVMGSRLLRERGAVRKALLPYLEGMVPAVLLVWSIGILASLWVLGARPNLPLWFFALMMGVLGLTVTAVLRRWHWSVRFPLDAAWIALLVVSPWIGLR